MLGLGPFSSAHQITPQRVQLGYVANLQMKLKLLIPIKQPRVNTIWSSNETHPHPSGTSGLRRSCKLKLFWIHSLYTLIIIKQTCFNTEHNRDFIWSIQKPEPMKITLNKPLHGGMGVSIVAAKVRPSGFHLFTLVNMNLHWRILLQHLVVLLQSISAFNSFLKSKVVLILFNALSTIKQIMNNCIFN